MAFAWNPSNLRASETVRNLVAAMKSRLGDWPCVMSNDGLFVFQLKDTLPSNGPCLLAHQSGVVLGRLFRSNSGYEDSSMCQIAESPLADTGHIVATGGTHLIERYWGHYVAFIYDAATGIKRVLSSPMSYLPCLYARCEGATIFFSRVEDCAALEVLTFSFNWQYIGAQLATGYSLASETCINEISELKPGERAEVVADLLTTKFLWNPCLLTQGSALEDLPLCIRAARAATLSSVHTWAGLHERIIHTLSGGLDSSVILGCLKSAPTLPMITCINEYSNGDDGDERQYARTAAIDANCELLELERRSATDLHCIFNIARTASPCSFIPELPLTDMGAEVARARRTTGKFTGVLGDVVFYFHPPMPAAADYLRLHGLGKQLMSVVLNTALLARTSIWRVFRQAVRDAWLHPRHTDEFYWSILQLVTRQSGDLVSDGVGESFRDECSGKTRFLHPWFRSGLNTPPGKLFQIFEMSNSLNERPLMRQGDPEMIHPFSSQPLVELCLKIPTFMHMYNGWDRALARSAFVNDVPREILQRTSKGGAEGYAKSLIAYNRKFFQEILLDGVLANRHLLNRERIEAALSPAPGKSPTNPAELLMYAATEAWFASWRQSIAQTTT